MTGAEIAAIAGAVVWVLERVFSWHFKTKRTKTLKRISASVCEEETKSNSESNGSTK